MWEQEPAERIERLEPLILMVRSRRVILDADLARLYGVTTRRFNEAFRRNRDRFPDDFAFQLTGAEISQLRSKPAPTDVQRNDPQGNIQNRSQFATGSQKHRDPRFRPWVFSEHGALMAANILRSKRAAHMSVFVIRAFVRLREELAANSVVLKRLAEIDHTLLQHDAALRDLYRKLLPLLQPPSDPPKRRIGFHANDD
jgi:hypothetical protein